MGVGLLITVLMVCAAANAHDRHRPRKAKVHFLAAGMLLRGTWGFNQDSYLAEIVVKRDHSRQLVRILDEYSPLMPALPREALVADGGAALRIRRDESCDVAFGGIHLRAAPGDRMATLAIPLVYQPQLGEPVRADTLVPCYRIAR
jgi:hypothetical protein